jgi:hypothetical protein
MKLDKDKINDYKSVKSELRDIYTSSFNATNELYFKIDGQFYMTFEPLNVNPFDDTVMLLYIPNQNVPLNIKRDFTINQLI